MGGLGPGIGGLEILVIGLAALLVVGPKDLPMLMRRVGKVMAKARGMAAEFRASFDEMARQSELDELRKEVEALRTGQGMHRLGADAEAAFRDIKSDLERPLDDPKPALTSPDGHQADPAPEMAPLAKSAPALDSIAKADPKPKTRRAPRKTAAAPAAAEPAAPKSKAVTAAKRKPAARKPAS